MNIKLSDADKIKILNSDDLFGIMQRVLQRENKIDQDREHFWVIGLATNNRLLFIELVSKGTVNKTLVEPMEVFSLALQKRAVKIILAHNHPSGELKPSTSDLELTDRLIQVGKIVNTEVIDHLIITEKAYLSFIDTGLMQQLEESNRWVPDDQIEKKIKKQAKALGNEKAKKEQLKIAKKMKERGINVETISETTGLSVEEIDRL